ncbi:MAG: hypothetical protein LUH36_08475 [Oscillospiraceae bacterium]|nr:hypothetical protein [Oscillospiraceae bacterium]
MSTFLWLASSAIMLALLGCLAFRAVHELFGLELHKGAIALKKTLLAPEKWHPAVIFAASLIMLWLTALLGYAFDTGGTEGFAAHLYTRMTEAGDALRYIYIAENGYVSSGEYVNNIVFYPLYPFLMAGLGALLGGRTALAGMIISQVCYGFSAVFVAKLARRDCAHPRAALAAYWLYPFGFFCLGVFTEGLFLLLAAAGLYCIRERKWALAGIVGFFCALTRVQGLLLLLPGVYCAWRDVRARGWRWRMLWLAGPLCGFGIYLLINKIVCGDFLAFQYYESISPWWQTTQWLGRTVAQQWAMALDYPGLAKWIYWPQLAIYFIAAALLFAGRRQRLDTAYILHGAAYLGMCYTASWLISGGRYMLGCIPIYMCVGSLDRKWLRYSVLAGETAFMLLCNYWFMQGQAIM